MSRNDRGLSLLFSVCALACLNIGKLEAGVDPQGTPAPVRKRLVQASDAITMRVVANYAPPATFSPDRSKAAIVLQKGDLKTNSVTYTLFVWREDARQRLGAPQQLLSLASTSIRPGIQRVAWLDDNRTLFFLGEGPDENQQLYRLDVETGRVLRCTNHSTSIKSYSSTPDGQFAFVAEQPAQNIVDRTVAENGLVIGVGPEFQLPDLLRLSRGGASARADPHVFLGLCGGVIRPISIPVQIAPWGPTPYISPDGKYVLIEELLDNPPASWGHYRYHNVDRRTGVLNVTSGRYDVLLDSPQGLGGSEIAWAADSHSAVISNTFLATAADIADHERQIRLSTPFPVEVTIPEGNVVKIDAAGGDLSLRGWDQKRNVVFFAKRGLEEQPPTAAYEKRADGSWQKLQSDVGLEDVVMIRQIEDLNTPPKLYAVDPKSLGLSLLLDLNPQFANLQFAHVEAIKWKAAGGYDVVAGLYYPVDYVPGRRYPLVIQTHGFDPTQFLIDGPNSSSFAAQALAARGIMVVQLDNDFVEDFGTFKEMERESAKFEDTIAFLDEKGLIDPQHVGIIGFSRTCLYVKYALTRNRFAAASVEDGWDGGYWQFLNYGNFSDTFNASHTAAYDGQLPFGEGLATWSSRSPGFNVDKVQTPLRILAPGPSSLLGEWEWFSALKILHKPVEMVLMQEDEHPLVRPWNRRISQEGNVDWFDFWLTGHEDPDPSKAEQYKRWRIVRAVRDRDAVQSGH